MGDKHIIRPWKWAGPLAPLLVFSLLLGLCFFLSRVTLVGLHWGQLSDFDAGLVLLQGLRMDLVTLAYLLLLPGLVLIVLPNSILQSVWLQRLIAGTAGALTGLAVLLEASTPTYMEHFGARPGRIFFEYLIYPREIMLMMWADFRLETIVVMTLSITAAFIFYRLVLSASQVHTTWSRTRRLVTLPLFLAAILLAGRSSLDHRPVNPSSVAIGNSQEINELPLNSVYSLFYAVYRMKDESSLDSYPKMSRAEVLSRMQKLLGLPSVSSDLPTLRRVTTVVSDKPKNLVIIVQESLGAQFVGSLGGEQLTPALDDLRENGLWFDQLYATGIRSARGLEAIVTGFPPSPARSVLKLGLAQGGFYTLAQTLRQAGYQSHFVYGGESHFDNMGGFFLANGFDQVIDEGDYDAELFRATWGVADESVYAKAHEIFLNQQKPFFGLIFTSSFHSPFEIPPGRLPKDADRLSAKNRAIRYADWSLGEYLKLARKASYYRDTVFLVVADHDERVRGDQLVPIHSFHIPGVFFGANVPSEVVATRVSQLDLLPTALALMGLSATIPAVGRNLMSPTERAASSVVMMYGNNHAYLKGDNVIIHRPHLPAAQFFLQGHQLIQTDQVDGELAQDALAWLHLPAILYQEKIYRLEALAKDLDQGPD